MKLTQIAVFHSPFPTKFGIPRQSGVVPQLSGWIEFLPEYRNADYIRGIDEFDYLWLLWGFSANTHQAASATVRPPLLGGNKTMGVFATRSPYRPSPIGLSSVRLLRVEQSLDKGPVLYVAGADLMDGTPIYDIKPYLEYADSHTGIRSGFTDTNQWQKLEVLIPERFRTMFSADELLVLEQVLSQDPRPHYHHDPARVYGMPFGNHDIRFRVESQLLTVVDVKKLTESFRQND